MRKETLFVSLIVASWVILVLFSPVSGATAAVKAIKIGIIGPMDLRTGNHLFITAQMAVEKITVGLS